MPGGPEIRGNRWCRPLAGRSKACQPRLTPTKGGSAGPCPTDRRCAAIGSAGRWPADQKHVNQGWHLPRRCQL